VTLKAHTSHEEKEEKGVYYRREMSYGEYQRAVALLHTVNGENAGATFKDGVLELTLPKLERTSRNKGGWGLTARQYSDTTTDFFTSMP
jgi:HSP20 family protein